jgi:hypothetical protein
LFAYVITALYVGPDWKAIARDALVPSVPNEQAAWGMLVAILGTTISPYLFFWQASQEVEEEKAVGRLLLVRRRGATRQELTNRRLDVGIGTFFSNIVASQRATASPTHSAPKPPTLGASIMASREGSWRVLHSPVVLRPPSQAGRRQLESPRLGRWPAQEPMPQRVRSEQRRVERYLSLQLRTPGMSGAFELHEALPSVTRGPAASTCSIQYVMPMSRYIVVAVATCSCACSRARAPVELAEAEVAVGDEGAHPELLGERKRLAIVALSVVRGIVAGGDLAEEAKGPRLVAALTALAGKGQGSPGAFESVLEPVSEDVRFAQIHQELRLDNSVPHSLTDAQRPLQQWDALSNPPRERVVIAQPPFAYL